MSKAEEAFKTAWDTHGLPGADIQTQYHFHPERKFRFDFAFPSIRLAVEINGMGYGHQAIPGVKRDIEKRRLAAALGWQVIEFETGELASENKRRIAVEELNEIISLRLYHAQQLVNNAKKRAKSK